MIAKPDDVTALVLSLCSEEGLRTDDDLLHCMVMSQALVMLGVKSSPVVCDAAFDDSDVEGVRVFAHLLDGQPHDMFGRSGWFNIIERHMDGYELYSSRMWHQVELSNQLDTLADEVAGRPAGFLQLVDRLSGLAVATMHAQSIARSTPAAQTVPIRRVGL